MDFWDVAYLQGARSGYVHTYVEEVERDGATLLRAATELRLTVKRTGAIIQLGMDFGTYETMEGKVVGTFLKHFLGTTKTLEITGVVEGDWLRLKLDKVKEIKPAPWNSAVVGLARQLKLYQERHLQPGAQHRLPELRALHQSRRENVRPGQGLRGGGAFRR